MANPLETQPQPPKRASRLETDQSTVLILAHDSSSADALANIVRFTLPRAEIARVYTGFQALVAVQRRPNEFSLLLLAQPPTEETLDVLRRIRVLVPSIPAILVNDRGAGAVLVAREARARRAQGLPAQAVTEIWRNLRTVAKESDFAWRTDP